MTGRKQTYANVGSGNGKHSAGGRPVLCEVGARWAVEAGGAELKVYQGPR